LLLTFISSSRRKGPALNEQNFLSNIVRANVVSNDKKVMFKVKYEILYSHYLMRVFLILENLGNV